MSTTQPAFQLLPGIEGVLSIPLSKLSTLEELGFRDASLVTSTRPINRSHVSHLVESDEKQWPTIKVVRVSLNTYSGSTEVIERYGVVDGRHRWMAAQRKKLDTIMVEVGSYQNEDEVIQAALSANLYHGMPAATRTRVAYALWLYELDGYNDLDIERLAHTADINASTIKRAIRKQIDESVQDEELIEKNTPLDIARLLVNSLTRFQSREIELFQRFIDVANYETEVHEVAQELQSYLETLTPLLFKKSLEALSLTVDIIMTTQEK